MRDIFQKIYESKHLNREESYKLFQLISSGKVQDIELASILIGMKVRGESTEEIIGAIDTFLKKMKYFPRPKYAFSDIVGTGGDSKNTINVSTAAAFVASSCGFKIVKHCNQGISSQSGSSDLLKKFNINFNTSSKQSRITLDRLNICFLFAPAYHDGFKYANHVRKILKTKTIFNFLGPFLNPARPPFTLIGVYDKKLIKTAIEILKQLKYQRGIVLNGNGTDEIALDGTTYVSELINEKIVSYELNPENFGVRYYKKIPSESSSKKNYDIIKKTMQGKGEQFYEELIAVNVAILLRLFGCENLKKNTQLALNKIRSGDVYKHIINVSNMLKEEKYARNNT